MPTFILTKPFLGVLFNLLFLNTLFFNIGFAQNTNSRLENSFSIEICDKNYYFLQEIENKPYFKETSLSELNKIEYKNRVWLKLNIKNSNKKFIDFNKNIDSIKVYHDNKIFLSGNLIARSEKQLPLSIAINAIQIPVYNQPFI